LQAEAQDTPERVALPMRSSGPVNTFIQSTDFFPTRFEPSGKRAEVTTVRVSARTCGFANCSRPKHAICARLALISEHNAAQVQQPWPKPVREVR
jgi:hypothetical protein